LIGIHTLIVRYYFRFVSPLSVVLPHCFSSNYFLKPLFIGPVLAAGHLVPLFGEGLASNYSGLPVLPIIIEPLDPLSFDSAEEESLSGRLL